MCQSRVDGNSYPPYSARRTKWIRIFSQRHETQIYILKQFIINRSTIAKLKLPNDMTVWFHLLTSPLVITSCQNGFLYSALATSSESDLKKQKKKKGKNKQTNKPKKTKQCTGLWTTPPLYWVWSRACPDKDLYRFSIDDIYILTKRSERDTIFAVFTNVEYIRFNPRQP